MATVGGIAMGDYGDGTVYQHGARWWIQYFHEGRRYREPGGLDGRGAKTEGEAKKRLKARMREIYGNTFITNEEARVTVGELLDDLMTHLRTRQAASARTVQSHLKHVRDELGSKRAAQVTTAMVEAHIEGQQKAGKANATINRQTGALRQAFNLAARRKPPKLSRVPYIPMLREDNARQGFVAPATFHAIIAGLPSHLADLATFAYMTGWRKGHVLNLRWDQVDFDGGRVSSGTKAKNKQAPGLPMSKALRALLERRWAARRYQAGKATGISTYVFHGGNGKAVVDFKRSWATACTAAGVPGVLFHDLRRSAVRNMVRAGVHQNAAMRISGHKTQAMFTRYDITSDDDKLEAMEKAAAYVETEAQKPPKTARMEP